MSFSIKFKELIEIKFIDSYQFIASSLDSLAKTLIVHPITKKFIPDLNLSQKQIYPYEYIDNFEKFDLKEFPDLKHFYNSLSEKNITEKDYNEAKSLYNSKFKKFGEWHDYYLLWDVLLLSDVFENFRSTSIQNYKIDPSHYVNHAIL